MGANSNDDVVNDDPGGATKAPTLIVADDEAEIAEVIETVAEDMGFVVVSSIHEGSAVAATAERLRPDVILLDLVMPGADGVEVLRSLGEMNCQASIVLMSGMDQRTLDSVGALGKDHKLKITSTLTKPMTIEAIEAALSPLLKLRASRLYEKKAVPEINYGLRALFQPDVPLDNEPVHALQRLSVSPGWKLDGQEIISGTELVEWAAQQGFAKGLTNMLVCQGLETQRLWAKQGFEPLLSMHINAELLHELSLPDILANAVDKWQLPPNRIIVEAPESDIVGSPDHVIDVLSRLRLKGFKIAICVKGSGDAILPMLARLPVDELVADLLPLMDKSLIGADMELEFQYSSLTSLAAKKGIVTCARNVDSEALLDFARQCQFKRVQGAQICRPLPADEIEALCKSGRLELTAFNRKAANGTGS
ncbi:MAG: EAL domain-containing protein [Pseudohongiellaceae bacterium]